LAEYKIYKIAKELNQTSPVIIEFLNNMGHETPKGHMSTVGEELYLEVLKRFNKARWQALQDQEQQDKQTVKRKKAERAREAELEKILAQTTEIPIGKEAPAPPAVTAVPIPPPEEIPP
jgi:hypothetical protein